LYRFDAAGTTPRMKKEIFEVHLSEVDTPLVDVIASRLRISKRKAKTILDLRNVFLNGERIWMAQHKVERKDIIEVTLMDAKVSQPNTGKKIDVLWKDAHYIIVNKPSGILTNEAKNSLEEELHWQFSDKSICAVHRLDRETSGCVIFARTQKDKDALIPVFKDQGVTKIYRAIVCGKFPSFIKTIHNDIDGESASTEIQILDARSVASYLEMRIRTGRTHQIRKHLQFVKRAVAGDKNYTSENKQDERLRMLPRQMLHAHKLIFKHPVTEQMVRVTAPVPADFKEALKALRLK
jgi:23S rRNA pseudouridine1911/1915/1917 synthase